MPGIEGTIIVIAIGDIIDTAISDHIVGLRRGKARGSDKRDSEHDWDVCPF
jgi:hypothetical protein